MIKNFVFLLPILVLSGCNSQPESVDLTAAKASQAEAKQKIEANDKLTPEQKKKALEIVGAGGPGK